MGFDFTSELEQIIKQLKRIADHLEGVKQVDEEPAEEESRPCGVSFPPRRQYGLGQEYQVRCKREGPW